MVTVRGVAAHEIRGAFGWEGRHFYIVPGGSSGSHAPKEEFVLVFHGRPDLPTNPAPPSTLSRISDGS